MTEFVINGYVDNQRNLIFQDLPHCSQGENNTVKLQVQLPIALAEECDFYFEFLCPHNLWVSPKAHCQLGNTHAVVSFLLPSCVLAEEGQVAVQLVARNAQDNSVLYKTALSMESSIVVGASVNACKPTEKVVDLFGQATQTLNKVEDKLNTLADVAFDGSYQSLVSAPTKLSQFVNDVGFATQSQINNVVPTHVSDLINDEDFISRYQNYTASQGGNYNSINCDEVNVADTLEIPFWNGNVITLFLEADFDDITITHVIVNGVRFDTTQFPMQKLFVQLHHMQAVDMLTVTINGKFFGTVDFDPATGPGGEHLVDFQSKVDAYYSADTYYSLEVR